MVAEEGLDFLSNSEIRPRAKTLRLHYAEQIELGGIKATAKVAQNLFNMAFELCRAREVPAMLNDFAGALGAAYYGTERRAEGLAMMEDAVRGFAEQNPRWQWWAGRVGALGKAYLVDGRLADANRIAQGRTAGKSHHQRLSTWWDTETAPCFL